MGGGTLLKYNLYRPLDRRYARERGGGINEWRVTQGVRPGGHRGPTLTM